MVKSMNTATLLDQLSNISIDQFVKLACILKITSLVCIYLCYISTFAALMMAAKELEAVKGPTKDASCGQKSQSVQQV